jgi:uncharacterized membrane protein
MANVGGSVKCPRCDEWRLPLQEHCPGCGLDLTVLRSLDELSNAVRQAQSDSNVVASRLRELVQQVASLEPRIINQISSPPAPLQSEQSPPEHEQTAPPESPTARVTIDATGDVAAAPPLRPAWATAAQPAVERSPVLSGIAEVRLGQKWLLIAGVVITVLAVGYFLKYSFDRNWIGPTGRVLLAYLAGLATLSVGEFCRRKKFELFGLYLFGGGIAVLYFASYAAFQIYDLIGQLPAFGLMALVTAVAGVLSLRHDTKWLAVLGIIGGFLTPVVLSTGTDNQIALMGYMAILNGGILAIAAFKQWRLLNHLGMTATWLLFSAWYVNHYAEPNFWTTTVFLNLFFLIHALVPFAYYFVKRSGQQVSGFGITIPNTFIAFGYSFAMVRSQPIYTAETGKTWTRSFSCWRKGSCFSSSQCRSCSRSIGSQSFGQRRVSFCCGRRFGSGMRGFALARSYFCWSRQRNWLSTIIPSYSSCGSRICITVTGSPQTCFSAG